MMRYDPFYRSYMSIIRKGLFGILKLLQCGKIMAQDQILIRAT